MPSVHTCHSQDAQGLKPFPLHTVVQTRSGGTGKLNHLASVVQTLGWQGWDSDRCGLTLELMSLSPAGLHLHRQVEHSIPNVRMLQILEFFGFGDIGT